MSSGMNGSLWLSGRGRDMAARLLLLIPQLLGLRLWAFVPSRRVESKGGQAKKRASRGHGIIVFECWPPACHARTTATRLPRFAVIFLVWIRIVLSATGTWREMEGPRPLDRDHKGSAVRPDTKRY